MKMDISVLGTGAVGQAIAQRLADQGHRVFMGTRNVTKSLSQTDADERGTQGIGTFIKDHPDIQLVTFKESVRSGNDVIVFAMNGKAALDCLKSIGDSLLDGKVLIDISNPLDFSYGFPPSLFVCNTGSLGELIQETFPTLHVVKTLNTMSNPVMVNPSLIKGDHVVFLSGNNLDAKTKVTLILNSFGWENKNIIDLGDITTARATEMILPLWIRLFSKFHSPLFNFNISLAKQ